MDKIQVSKKCHDCHQVFSFSVDFDPMEDDANDIPMLFKMADFNTAEARNNCLCKKDN